MNHNRLQDQVLIMGAIKLVKQQLDDSNPDNWVEQGEISVRLTTLYSLLDIDRLMVLAIRHDKRVVKEKAA